MGGCEFTECGAVENTVGERNRTQHKGETQTMKPEARNKHLTSLVFFKTSVITE